MESLNQYISDFRGIHLRIWLKAHMHVLFIIGVLYVVLVLYVPKHIMAHRPPMKLRACNALWNLFLTIFSIGGAYHCVPRLLESIYASQISGLVPMHSEGPHAVAPVLAGSFYNSVCVWNDGLFIDGPLGVWIAMFLISKVVELMDTVFLVLQKKPVIFLHWYHHLTVLIFCWRAYTGNIPSSLFFGTMNYCVHAVMYFYYFVCACGFRKVIRPIAPIITTMQILQMVIGTFIVGYTAYHRHLSGYGCDVDDTNIKMGLMMYVSYLILFTQLFYRNYICPAVKKKEGTVCTEEKKSK